MWGHRTVEANQLYGCAPAVGALAGKILTTPRTRINETYGIHCMKLYLRSTSSLEIIWGDRKRKLPTEINCNCNSRPKGELAVDQKCVDTLHEELFKSNCQHFVCKFLSYHPEDSCSAGPPKVSSDKENTPTPIASPLQRSEGWFQEQIGKVTFSKAPALIGLQGREEFVEMWDCIVNKKEEPIYPIWAVFTGGKDTC